MEEELPQHERILDENEARQIAAELGDIPGFYESRFRELPRYRQASCSLTFHEAQRQIATYEERIADRRARLNKLFECKEEYF